MAQEPPKKRPSGIYSSRAEIEKTPRGMPSLRDHAEPKHGPLLAGGVPHRVDGDVTPPPQNVVDIGTWREVHEISKELAIQKGEISHVKGDISSIKGNLASIDAKQDTQNEHLAEIKGSIIILMGDRHEVTSTRTKTLVQETAQLTTRETLAEQVLREASEVAAHKRKMWQLVASGVFSGAVLTAIIALIAKSQGC